MITILDYTTGNVASFQKVLNRMGIHSRISSNPQDVRTANKLILPGVGHFVEAMSYLNETGLKEALNEKVLVQKTPVLGICLGMQLMCTYSEEVGVGSALPPGLGWFDAKVTRMRVKDSFRYKIPHTGWNGIEFQNGHLVLDGLERTILVCPTDNDVMEEMVTSTAVNECIRVFNDLINKKRMNEPITTQSDTKVRHQYSRRHQAKVLWALLNKL